MLSGGAGVAGEYVLTTGKYIMCGWQGLAAAGLGIAYTAAGPGEK